MKTFRNMILAGAACFCMSSLCAGTSQAEGLPLPWPFPWAKDCSVDWSSLQGRYLLSDSDNKDRIDLKITVITKNGFKLMRVSRYAPTGEMLFEGFTFVSEKQKSIRVYLMPTNGRDAPVWAVLKLHFQSWDLQCSADHLVPILTLEGTDTNRHQQIQYKLVRLE